MAITVKELIRQLSTFPEDAQVVAQTNHSGFNGMAGSVHWASMRPMAVNKGGYGVWADSPGWSSSKPEDVKNVVILM